MINFGDIEQIIASVMGTKYPSASMAFMLGKRNGDAGGGKYEPVRWAPVFKHYNVTESEDSVAAFNVGVMLGLGQTLTEEMLAGMPFAGSGRGPMPDFDDVHFGPDGPPRGGGGAGPRPGQGPFNRHGF